MLHQDWLEQRPWTLPCGHTLRTMEYNCHECQKEYVSAEQYQMVVRPEGMPPLAGPDGGSPGVGGTYQWDFISRNIRGFVDQLSARGTNGYNAQLMQYLSGEAARFKRLVVQRPMGGATSPTPDEAALSGILQFRLHDALDALGGPPMGAERSAAPASGSGSQGAEPFAAPGLRPADAAAATGLAVSQAAAAFGFTPMPAASASAHASTLPSPGPPAPHPPPGWGNGPRTRTWEDHHAHKHNMHRPGMISPMYQLEPSKVLGPGRWVTQPGTQQASCHFPYFRQIWVPDAQPQGAEPFAAPAAGSSGSGSRETPGSQQPEGNCRSPRRRRMQCSVGLDGTDVGRTYWSESFSGSPSPVTQPEEKMTPAQRLECLNALKLEWCSKNCREALGVLGGGGDTGGALNCPHCRRYSPYYEHSSSSSSGSRGSPESQQQPEAPAADADGSAGSSVVASFLAGDDSEDDGALLAACKQAEAGFPSPPANSPPTPRPPSGPSLPVWPSPSPLPDPTRSHEAGAAQPLSADR